MFMKLENTELLHSIAPPRCQSLNGASLTLPMLPARSVLTTSK